MSWDPISPAAPIQQRFQSFESRLTTIEPSAKSARIADDFLKQVEHLHIERLRRL
jgi:hypothetical protein